MRDSASVVSPIGFTTGTGIDRDNFDAEVSRRVHGGEGDFPWMTVPRALAELEQLMAALPAAQHEIIQALREEHLAR